MVQNEKLTYTVKEMAQGLGIGVNKAYELTRLKGFPVLKLGKRTLIPVKELKNWISSNVYKF